MKRRQLIASLTLPLFAACSAFLSSSASAQTNWPERPVKLLVGYSAGGPVDVSARTFARFLGEQLKQSVVVENRAGASGMIAADATAKANPDGYTLNFVASPSLTISPIVQKSTLFDPRKDFTLFGLVVNYANVLLIGPQIPAKNLQELIDYAKKNPDKVSFGSAGFGGSNHLSAELLKQATGTQMLHVPYKGNAPAMMDVVSGKITFMFDITGTGRNFIANGQARGLAVTSKQRNPSLPNVPTMIEAGIADYEVVGWFGVTGPKGIPSGISDKLVAAINAVKKNPEYQKAVEEGGYSVDMGDIKEFANRIDRELNMWGQVITKGNIQAQ